MKSNGLNRLQSVALLKIPLVTKSSDHPSLALLPPHHLAHQQAACLLVGRGVGLSDPNELVNHRSRDKDGPQRTLVEPEVGRVAE